MNNSHLRAWWAHKQGLDGSLRSASPASVLEQSGWARSVGGAGPYMTLFARAGIGRDDADAAVTNLEIHELPAARGCTYVVPASDFSLALRVSQGFGDEAQISTAKKYLGITDAELDRLSQAVLDALDTQPLDPRELKEALGDVVRNLGAEGKKRGTTTTLPLALGKLQTAGEIRRVPISGRLDQQRYRYIRWHNPPHQHGGLSDEEAYCELARRYFRWIGPATLANFQWFSGLSGKLAKPAVAALGLAPLTDGDSRLLFPDDLEALHRFQPAARPHFVLTSGLDNITHLRRDVGGLLAEDEQTLQAFDEKGTLITLGGLGELPNQPILDRGQLVGMWDYDPEAQKIVWATFRPQPESLQQEIARIEVYIRNELGDFRIFSLDSAESRKPRLAALRKMRL
ncbi:MAG: crosslink repair DNA glycosylase YcaQ family protein [Caldilineaceae bacterium]